MANFGHSINKFWLSKENNEFFLFPFFLLCPQHNNTKTSLFVSLYTLFVYNIYNNGPFRSNAVFWWRNNICELYYISDWSTNDTWVTDKKNSYPWIIQLVAMTTSLVSVATNYDAIQVFTGVSIVHDGCCWYLVDAFYWK